MSRTNQTETAPRVHGVENNGGYHGNGVHFEIESSPYGHDGSWSCFDGGGSHGPGLPHQYALMGDAIGSVRELNKMYNPTNVFRVVCVTREVLP